MKLTTMRNGGGIHVNLIPGTFRPVVNKDNDYMMIARRKRRTRPIAASKASRCRTRPCRRAWAHPGSQQENLTSTDNGVIMARVRLRKGSARGATGQGAGRVDPKTHAVRSASIVLPESVSFHEGAADALKVREGTAPIRS